MSVQEEEFVKKIMEVMTEVGILKGERDALKKEVEYLRGLLTDKLAEKEDKHGEN